METKNIQKVFEDIEKWLDARKKDNNTISVIGTEKMLIKLRNKYKVYKTTE